MLGSRLESADFCVLGTFMECGPSALNQHETRWHAAGGGEWAMTTCAAGEPRLVAGPPAQSESGGGPGWLEAVGQKARNATRTVQEAGDPVRIAAAGLGPRAGAGRVAHESGGRTGRRNR